VPQQEALEDETSNSDGDDEDGSCTVVVAVSEAKEVDHKDTTSKRSHDGRSKLWSSSSVDEEDSSDDTSSTTQGKGAEETL